MKYVVEFLEAETEDLWKLVDAFRNQRNFHPGVYTMEVVGRQVELQMHNRESSQPSQYPWKDIRYWFKGYQAAKGWTVIIMREQP